MESPTPPPRNDVQIALATAWWNNLSDAWKRAFNEVALRRSGLGALREQRDLVKRLATTTRAGDGVWRLPRGDEIYQDALRQFTQRVKLQQTQDSVGDSTEALKPGSETLRRQRLS